VKIRIEETRQVVKIDTVTKDIVCNKCGKSCKDTYIPFWLPNFGWHYFGEVSKGEYAGQVHKFDLCDSCYTELINSFIHQIDPDYID
jgi:transcription initiation factor TFIIIB Brf1 subunit/transcription initiation factor TFIIB